MKAVKQTVLTVSPSRMYIRKITPAKFTKKWLQTWGKFYIDGNKVVGNTTVSNDNWTKGVFEQMDNKNCATTELWNQHTQIKSSSPVVKTGNVRTHTPDEAYERVMSYAGASNYRDKVDELIISDVKNRKASCTGDASKWEGLSGYSQNKKWIYQRPERCLHSLRSK